MVALYRSVQPGKQKETFHSDANCNTKAREECTCLLGQAGPYLDSAHTITDNRGWANLFVNGEGHSFTLQNPIKDSIETYLSKDIPLEKNQ